MITGAAKFITHPLKFSLLSLSCLTIAANSYAEMEMEGKAGFEIVGFNQQASSAEQHNFYLSGSIEPEFYQAIGDNSEFKAKLFYRYDANSVSRTHGDIRELMFYQYADDWEIHAGIGKVFWGTTESRHLVDGINQIDNIESLDDEQRLGQPMIMGKLIRDWGTVDLFVLPGFREQDFGQADLRPQIANFSSAHYQDSARANHIDFAARWNHTIDDLDIAVSYFNGTQRTPILNPVAANTLQPVYVQTQNIGVDGQYIAGDWLLKFEGLYRNGHKYSTANGFQSYDSKALVTGFEYSFIGINEDSHDLGLIGEYLYDEWSETTPFQRDWMTGLRWVWNDENSTEMLLGHIIDLDDQSQIWQLEASRRLNDDWSAELTARWVTNVDSTNTFANILKGNDLLSIKFDYYY